MEKQITRAMECRSQGYNCAQSVFCAYCTDHGVTLESGYRLAEGLGGGLGGAHDGVCGALSAACLLAGMVGAGTPAQPGEGKAQTYERVRALCAAFHERHGSTICRDLLGLDLPEDERPPNCNAFIQSAAELAGRMLEGTL